ncbi:MAG TPA: hypothetical protein VIK59_10065 [Verrucomicrobiae bacterium]
MAQQPVSSQQLAQLPMFGFTQVDDADVGANCIASKILNKMEASRFTKFYYSHRMKSFANGIFTLTFCEENQFSAQFGRFNQAARFLGRHHHGQFRIYAGELAATPPVNSRRLSTVKNGCWFIQRQFQQKRDAGSDQL